MGTAMHIGQLRIESFCTEETGEGKGGREEKREKRRKRNEEKKEESS